MALHLRKLKCSLRRILKNWRGLQNPIGRRNSTKKIIKSSQTSSGQTARECTKNFAALILRFYRILHWLHTLLNATTVLLNFGNFTMYTVYHAWLLLATLWIGWQSWQEILLWGHCTPWRFFARVQRNGQQARSWIGENVWFAQTK